MENIQKLKNHVSALRIFLEGLETFLEQPEDQLSGAHLKMHMSRVTYYAKKIEIHATNVRYGSTAEART